MGTWDVGPFDNDAAADWLAGFVNADRESGTAAITEALTIAATKPPESWLDTYEGCEAVAAAEVVAVIGGLPVEDLPYAEHASAWTAATRPVGDPALYARAVSALERVLAPRSELVTLWDAEAPGPVFRKAVADRIASLRNLCPAD